MKQLTAIEYCYKSSYISRLVQRKAKCDVFFLPKQSSEMCLNMERFLQNQCHMIFFNKEKARLLFPNLYTDICSVLHDALLDV